MKIRTWLIRAGVAIAVILALLWLSPDHQRFRAFSAHRDDWHRRCDAYVGRSNASLGDLESIRIATDCARELQALMAYAQEQGWRDVREARR